MDTLTFSELAKMEPRLLDLEREIRAVEDIPGDSSLCANRLWYAEDGFKDRLCFLVGWSAGVTREEKDAAVAAVIGPPGPGRRPFLTEEEIMRMDCPKPPSRIDARLTTSEAYSTAYEHLYEQLPGCRNCQCL